MDLFVQKSRTRKLNSFVYSGFSSAAQATAAAANWRLRIIGALFVAMALAIVFGLIKLQIFNGEYYVALASDKHEIFEQLYPKRGTIYATERSVDGAIQATPVATNRELNFIYAVPKDIKDLEAVTRAILESLDFSDEIKNYKPKVDTNLSAELNEEEALAEKKRREALATQEAVDLFSARLRERLSKADDPHEPIKHRVSDAEWEKLKAYNLEGINRSSELARYYPEKNIGSQVYGFVGHSSENNMLKGYYGIEGNYDQELAGTAGYLRGESDTAGRLIALAGKDYQAAVDGADVYLTIDKNLEYFACERLREGVISSEATGGSVIIMNPQTGAILAMCNYPDFDPEKYNKVENISLFNNNAVNSTYEPGSIFKPITMAAAIDAGKVTPFSTYVDKGVERVAGFDIKNSDEKAHGVQTMTGVLELSLNTGTIFAVRQIGNVTFGQYVRNFGFGRKSGVDLSPEASGDIKSLDNKGEIFMDTASFGQGITVTPLQMVVAYGALANNGQIRQPYIVDKIVYPDGTEKKTEPRVIANAVSATTAKHLGSMLVSVVENGHSQGAKIPGYLLGGKTGTAQVASVGGYGADTIHSFIGFAPLENPQFVMLVKMDNVKKGRFAESSALPTFTKIAKFFLNYYAVPTTVKK